MSEQTTKTIQFEKHENGSVKTCEVEFFDDGSAGLFGEGIDSWIFEFTDDALKRAIKKAEDAGYVRVDDKESQRNVG
jgi:hypothetical protein